MIQTAVKERSLQGADYKNARLEHLDFSHTDLSNADFSNSLCVDCNFSHAVLRNVDFSGADLRGCNLSYADISGANMFASLLEHANLEQIISDDNTQYFALRCPEKGAFIGYKVCFDYRLVKLLIPADARRVSATGLACRCDKAKVLWIKSYDFSKSYNEAFAYVDPNFVYRVGETSYAHYFNPDRWVDSTGGLHFYMTREEAMGYM